MEKITARMSEIFAYFLVVGLGLSPTRMMNIVRQVREEKKILTVQAHVDTAEDRTTEGAENQEKQRIRFARVCCDSDLDRVGLLRVNNFWRRRYPRLLLFHVGNMDVIGVVGFGGVGAHGQCVGLSMAKRRMTCIEGNKKFDQKFIRYYSCTER